MKIQKRNREERIGEAELQQELLKAINKKGIFDNEASDRMIALMRFKPDLKGSDIDMAVNYLPVLNDGQLMQAAIYSTAYGLNFTEAARVVMEGMNYTDVQKVAEIHRIGGFPLNKSKHLVKEGCTPENVKQAVGISTGYRGVPITESLEMAMVFGNASEEMIEADFRPYREGGDRTKEKMNFFVFPSKKEGRTYIIYNITNEDPQTLTGRVYDMMREKELETVPLSPGSSIYFITSDVSTVGWREGISGCLGSVCKNIIQFSPRGQSTKFQDQWERDPGLQDVYEHMDATRMSGDKGLLG